MAAGDMAALEGLKAMSRTGDHAGEKAMPISSGSLQAAHKRPEYCVSRQHENKAVQQHMHDSSASNSATIYLLEPLPSHH